MSSPRVIAVTGASSYLGRSVAVRLVQEGHRVIAMDRQPPKYPIPDAEVVEIDLQNPLMPDILRHYGVEQLVHTDFQWERRETRAGHERNAEAPFVGVFELLAELLCFGVEFHADAGCP